MPNPFLMAVVVLAGISLLLVLRGSPEGALRLWLRFGQFALAASLVPWHLVATVLQVLFGSGATTHTRVVLGMTWAYGPMALLCLAFSGWFWRSQREGRAVAAAVLVPSVYVLALVALCSA
jgi:hypothetical protein